MISTFEDGGQFVLVLNARDAGDNSYSGTYSQSAGRTILTFDRCWTGEKWVPQIGFAKRFNSFDEAETYLSENRHMMEQAEV